MYLLPEVKFFSSLCFWPSLPFKTFPHPPFPLVTTILSSVSMGFCSFSFCFKVHLQGIFFYCCAVTVVLPFSLLLSPPSPADPTVSPHSMVHTHGSSLHVPWLAPSPSFPVSPSHLPSGHCQFVLFLFSFYSLTVLFLFTSQIYDYSLAFLCFLFFSNKKEVIQCVSFDIYSFILN